MHTLHVFFSVVHYLVHVVVVDFYSTFTWVDQRVVARVTSVPFWGYWFTRTVTTVVRFFM